MSTPGLSAVGKTALQGDPGRFEAAMFAPEDRREHLFALIALNVELSRIPETVTEPMLGEIRLQWWEDAIAALFEDGPIAGHEVIAALKQPVDAGLLVKARLTDLIDARRITLSDEPLTDAAVLDRLISQTGGALAALQIGALGGDKAAQDVAADAGWAEGAGRLIAALPSMIPNTDHENGEAPAKLLTLIQSLASDGLAKLNDARNKRRVIPRSCRVPLLSIRPAERRLRSALQKDADILKDDSVVSPFRERMSLFRRAITGRF